MKTKTYKIYFNLRSVLSALEISQREAARRTGISKNGISVLAGEPSQISMNTLSKLCSGLNMKPEAFFVIEEN